MAIAPRLAGTMNQKPVTDEMFDEVASHVRAHPAMPDDVEGSDLAMKPWPSWTNHVNARPFNWIPSGALDTLKSEDTGVYVELILEYLDSAAAWCDANEKPYPREDSHAMDVVIGEMLTHAPRLIDGHLGEVKGSSFVREELGRVIVPTPDALDMKGYKDVEEMENDGVDFVTADGDTWQVKASENVDESEIDADHLIQVVNGEVKHTPLK